MKNHLNAYAQSRHVLNVILTACLMFPLPSLAGTVTLATSPLATSSTSAVMPNIMFMLDDSGSMDWDYMPDDSKNFSGKYGFNTNHCNGVYFDPTITYTPPVDSTGTSYANANFSAAWKTGYNTGAGTTNLNTGFTGGSGSGSSGASGYTGPAFYYTYSGTQTTGAQMDFHNTNSIFYKECISAVGSTTKVDGTNPVNTVFSKVRLATTPTTTITVTPPPGVGATITISASSSARVNSIQVSGLGEIMSGKSSTPSPTSSTSSTAANIAAKINACSNGLTGTCTVAGFVATVSGSVITINGPAAGSTLTVTVSNGTMTYTQTAFPNPPNTSVSSITVNGVDLLAGVSTAAANSSNGLATLIKNGIIAAGYSASVSGNVVTVTYTGAFPNLVANYAPVIITNPGTGGMLLTTDAFPESTPAVLQNFANWYSYYSNRMLMMKTGVGQAFAPISSKYRVGFMTMNNNVSPDIVDINDFNASQRSNWYSKLYGATPANSTPLREALSHVGQLYAHRFGSYSTYTATITVGGSGGTGVDSLTVNGTETLAGGTNSSTSTTTLASYIAAQINLLDPSDYGASSSGNKVTITGPASALGLYPIVIDDGGGMTFSTTAFVKNTITAQLNGITPADPVQYSCQQNFVILSTDGYWNGSTTYDLSNPTLPVGNQDGTAARPMYDGATATKTTSQTYQSQTQMTQTTSQLQKRVTQIQSSTSNLQSQTSQLQAQTSSLQSQTSQLQGQTSSLQSQTSQLQGQTSSLQSQTSQLQAQTSSLQSQTSQLQAQTSSLQSQTSQLQAQTSSLQTSTMYLQSSTKASAAAAWTAYSTAATCTWKTSGTYPYTQCRYVTASGGSTVWSAGAATWAGAASCTTSFGSVTTNGTSWSGNGTSCQYTAWSAWAGTSACTALARSAGPTNYTVGTATQCQTVVTSPYANAASCTASATPNASGNTTQCQYTAWSAWAGTSACTALARSAGPTNYTVGTATQCQTVVTSPFANAASCTASATPNASGNTTQCQYTAWSAWAGTSACTAAAQSAGPTNYTVGTAKQCQTVVTSPYANAASCTASATPNASGNTTQCQYTAWSAWAGTSACTAAAQSAGPTNYTVGTAKQCQTVVTSPYANAASCTASATPNASGNTTQCQYTAWSAWAGTSACTAAAQSAGPTNYTVGTAKQCQTVVTSPYANAASCTASATPNASGNTTQCQYTAWSAGVGTPTCTAVAKSAGPTNYTVGTATQCQTVVTSPYANAASCTASATPNASGNTTQCQYTAYGAWANASSCAAAAPSGGSPYTVGVAIQCQTLDTGWIGASSCTNSGPTNGQTVLCPNPNPVVTGPNPVATCTAQTANAGNNYMNITCATNTVQATTLVGSCSYVYPSASNNYIGTNCNVVTLSTTNNVPSCSPGNSGPPFYIQTSCTGTAGGTSDTLADVAMYYYQTDLRDSSLSNCNGATSVDFPSGNPDVCTNNVFISGADNNVKQHLTTFTLGLGARGRMVYSSKDYMNDTSGDFYSVRIGAAANLASTPPVCSWQSTGTTCNWPIPSSGNIANIDDLWHAAVNGRGTYFSATDPAALSDGLTSALSSITARKGAAAAAATSTLNPVAGNNYAYVASYTTVKWIGNLEARTINTINGVVDKNATWCVENITPDLCIAPGVQVPDTSGSSVVYNCVTPSATAATCISPGVFDSVANTCSVQMALACNGAMPSQVGLSSDTRHIYTANNAGSSFINFDAAYATANPTNFSAAHINSVSQWPTLTVAQRTAAEGVNLINYLRGQTDHEDTASNPVANRLYRFREATLGDALESQPAFIGAPTFSYADTGYSAFVTAKAPRIGMVYMGTNDGMMHAFYAKDRVASYTPPAKCVVGAVAGDYCGGEEAWAYVPTTVIPNLYKLADSNYSTQHVNYINGSPIISDYYCTVNCPSGAPEWRTMLVGGLNGGGRGYYALDITDPTTPRLLWEFTSSKAAPYGSPNLGYTFGIPVVTKMANGTWVVVVTSGYDNGTYDSDGVTAYPTPGDGLGHLFVLDAQSGAIIKTISTPNDGLHGTPAAPSGLARIAAWNDDPASNQAGYIYGGDLLGNVWRFDINSLSSPFLFASLKDASGNAQPVTTTPVLGLILNKRVVFVGTGKYLEISDLTNTNVQSLYAIKDDNATATLVSPRLYTATAPRMVQQTITPNGGLRTGSNNPVDFSVDRGWFVDFPDTGERVNIDSKLVQGTLLAPTLVPSNTACSPGGYGWLNFFDYATGWPTTDGSGVGAAGTNTNVSVKYDATIVGMNVLYIGGSPVVEVVTSDNPTPTVDTTVVIKPSTSNFTGMRMQWRELIP